jgi:lysozyme
MSLLDSFSAYFRARSDSRYEPVDPPRIEPLLDAPSPGRKRLAVIIGTSAVAGLIAVTAQWEGKSNTPYRDIVNVMTVCYGETRVEMRRYTDAECEDMLANGLADFAGPVLKRNPELRGHDPQIIAAVSLSYNIGGAAYNRSTVARRFSEGRWRSACDAIMRWNMAGGRPVRGLTNRRASERRICLRDIPARFDR